MWCSSVRSGSRRWYRNVELAGQSAAGGADAKVSTGSCQSLHVPGFSVHRCVAGLLALGVHVTSSAPDNRPVLRTPSRGRSGLGQFIPSARIIRSDSRSNNRQAKPPTAANFPTRSPGRATLRQHLGYLCTDWRSGSRMSAPSIHPLSRTSSHCHDRRCLLTDY